MTKREPEQEMTRVLRSKFSGGGPVTAVVRRLTEDTMGRLSLGVVLLLCIGCADQHRSGPPRRNKGHGRVEFAVGNLTPILQFLS